MIDKAPSGYGQVMNYREHRSKICRLRRSQYKYVYGIKVPNVPGTLGDSSKGRIAAEGRRALGF